VFKAPFFISLRLALDDKGRCVLVELVGMGPNPAVLRLFKEKTKGVVETLVGPEPDKFVGTQVDIGGKPSKSLLRILEFRPSAATIRSASPKSVGMLSTANSYWNTISTPSCRARA